MKFPCSRILAAVLLTKSKCFLTNIFILITCKLNHHTKGLPAMRGEKAKCHFFKKQLFQSTSFFPDINMLDIAFPAVAFVNFKFIHASD